MATLLNSILKYIANHIVVESGTIGIFSYKKYADGTFEMVCGSATTGTFEGVYFSANLYIAQDVARLPFTATSITYANGFAYTGTGSGWIVGLKVTNTWVATLEVAGNQGGSSTPNLVINYNLKIEGTWK